MKPSRTKMTFGFGFGLSILLLMASFAVPGCSGDNQTGVWIRIVSPDVSIKYVHLYIYDVSDGYASDPVADIEVPDPHLFEAQTFDFMSTDEENQLWVLIFAGALVDEEIRISGVGFRDGREVATGELEGIRFVPNHIVEHADEDGNQVFLELEGCQDKDEDGFCPPSDCDDEDPNVNPEVEEACDDKDNNCDGAKDEGCPCSPGDSRECWPQWAPSEDIVCFESASPNCPCRKGTQSCENGSWGGCVGLVVPQAEGMFDEYGQPFPCEEDNQGNPIYTCYPSCVDEIGGVEIDNDCDFFTNLKDSGCGGCIPGTVKACYTGPPETRNIGVCAEGSHTCKEDGTWPAECINETTPFGWSKENPDGATEYDKCDNLDNDCDTIVDNVAVHERCEWNEGCCRDAVKDCVNGAWVPCTIQDYQQFALGTCYQDYLGSDYEYYVEDETTAHCDGLDNDCNGAPDDVFDEVSGNRLCTCSAGDTSPCETSSVGECVPGDWICVNGEMVMDGTCHPAETERCDNRDNDCDNVTDLNADALFDCVDNLVGPQVNGEVIMCAQGVCLCDCLDGWWDLDGNLCTTGGSCEYECDPTPSGVERCDTIDNNCNGPIDAADQPLATVDALCPYRDGTVIPGRGIAGGPAEACVLGECQYDCSYPYDDCNNDRRLQVPEPGESDPSDGCEIDLTDTLEHCGACNNHCSFTNASAECINFTCELLDCNSNWGNCDGQDANGCETDLRITDEHCGQCDNDCGANAHCSSSACACDTGYRDCDSNWANGCEIDIRVDENNCGSCNNQCGQHAWCNNRNCDCDDDWGNCINGWSDGCETDLRSTDAHCAACGNNCGQHAYCSSSACYCDNTWENCNTNWNDGCEIQTTTDPGHCGSCTFVCNLPNVNLHNCVDSSCTIDSCDSGWEQCDSNIPNGCETHISQDPQNCGDCDNVCDLNHVNVHGCSNYVCRVGSCDNSWEDCNSVDSDGCEIQISSDPANCNGCDNACDLPHVNVHNCVDYSCEIGSCDSSWDDCDSVDSNGCEIQVSSDPANCNGCGNVCNLPHVNAHDCVNYNCTIVTCDTGWHHCDGDLANGCERRTDNDPSNCGGCDYLCNLPHVDQHGCVNSACTIVSCDINYEDCDGNASNGCETRTDNDPLNCGSCNFNCGQNTYCSGGTCQCNNPYGNCANGWSDGCETYLPTSHDHCGDCFNNCGQHATCDSSNCGCDSGWGNCINGWTDGCETPLGNDANCGFCGDTCGSGYYCNGSSCTACTLDNHCGAGCVNCSLQSSNQACVDTGGGVYGCGCVNDGDCDNGEYCNSGSCAACTADDNCGSNCDDCTGLGSNTDCIDIGGGNYQCGCNGDEDCAATGEYCSGNSCAACTADDNCGSNCDDCTGLGSNTDCVNIGGGVYQCGCNGDEDCAASGEYCSGTSCAACTVAANCGPDCDDCASQANDQACVLDGSYRCGCNDINDCDTGYFCNTSDTCEICDNHDSCGASCTDCASQVENQACIWFTDHWACGCINPSDCTDLTCTDNTCQ